MIDKTNFLYKIGDYSKYIHKFTIRKKGYIGRISEIYLDVSEDGLNRQHRYRIDGLWYDEYEIDLVTPKLNPEYFV